jgi:hypothetical protein
MKYKVNEKFFEKWSNKMAWVLGYVLCASTSLWPWLYARKSQYYGDRKFRRAREYFN